jgi:hypothetical protein
MLLTRDQVVHKSWPSKDVPVFNSGPDDEGTWGVEVQIHTFLKLGIAESEREGTRAETRIGLSAKRTSPFKSAGGSVQLTTGSRGVRTSRQDYWLPTPFASFPFTSPPVRHHVPSHSDSALLHKGKWLVSHPSALLVGKVLLLPTEHQVCTGPLPIR